MKLKIFEKSLCLALIMTVLVTFTGFTSSCEGIPGEVLRLHILANSDSDKDQALKLQVRDRILQESASLFDGCKTRAQAEAAAQKGLPRLQAAALAEVAAQGYAYTVKAELTDMYFTTRTYGETTLPAGVYKALRVEIGAAAGHNWWCVIFPAMCLPAAQEKKELAQVLSPEQLKLVEGGKQPGFQVAFKSVEIYEQLRDWLKKK